MTRLYGEGATLAAGVVVCVSAAVATGCTASDPAAQEEATAQRGERPPVARGPDEGEVRWMGPSSSEELGEGSLITLKVDRVSVPYTTMMVATQRLATSGIPVHLHTFEDEILYVLRGRGSAVVGEDRQEVPLEPGSVLYVPMGEWHGMRNADPDQRVEILVVTTPVKEGGLGDFFRNASVRPGHPPLNLPQEEFLALLSEYGMEVPDEPAPE